MKPVATISAGEFKAKCLKLMDEVARTGTPIVITKRGKPVAQLGPAVQKPKSLFGCMAGEIEILGDIISPIDVEWDAVKGEWEPPPRTQGKSARRRRRGK